jgi:hypothetical protein
LSLVNRVIDPTPLYSIPSLWRKAHEIIIIHKVSKTMTCIILALPKMMYKLLMRETYSTSQKLDNYSRVQLFKGFSLFFTIFYIVE